MNRKDRQAYNAFIVACLRKSEAEVKKAAELTLEAEVHAKKAEQYAQMAADAAAHCEKNTRPQLEIVKND